MRDSLSSSPAVLFSLALIYTVLLFRLGLTPLLLTGLPSGWCGGFHCLLESGSKFTLCCLGKVAAGLQPVGEGY